MVPYHAFLTLFSLWAIHTGAVTVTISSPVPESTSDVQLELDTGRTKTKASFDLNECVNVNPDGQVRSYLKTSKGYNFCSFWAEKDCKGDKTGPWLSKQEVVSPSVTVQSVKCKNLLQILL